MIARLLSHGLDAFAALGLGILLPAYIANTQPIRTLLSNFGAESGGVLGICLAIVLFPLTRIALRRTWKSNNGQEESIYGLEHSRLHLKTATPMWMNMGLWGRADAPQTLAEACRDLLNAVLAEAGFSREKERADIAKGTRRRKMLIDLGVGCGDQTVYLISEKPVRECDREWWDEREHCVHFDQYIGITKDVVQARYASERIEELKKREKRGSRLEEETKKAPNISLFCADASNPAAWSRQIQESLMGASVDDTDCWVLALDTAYHFSPSRWPLVKHAHTNLRASFMAFDLCLSPTITLTQRLVLRVLTMFMHAPWTNFGTPEDYRRKLVEIGYSEDTINIVDVSERVFGSLADYLDEQDARLKKVGFGIGKFSVAKALFGWWGRSGVVKGVIVVAKR
jgi:hypothetical protein